MLKAISNRLWGSFHREAAVDEAAVIAPSKFSVFSLVGHELRTPVNAIVGFAELLQQSERNHASPQTRSDYAATVVENAQKLQLLLNQILDAGRAEAGELSFNDQDCDLAETLETVARKSQDTAVEQTIIVRIIDGTTVRGDVHRLSQAFTALLDNAIRFSPSDGFININMQRGGGGDLIISVTDAGAGIAESDLARLLNPFAQASEGTARNHGGLGLGLYLARTIARHHGGDIELRSTPGIGTEARLTLPAERVIWPSSVAAVA